ncbi:pyridoxal phosphate-dependent aminotransferase [Colwellia hornerae]|uniref:Pyridoxal phosphate-dependent aminotransferase n=1 Tax=Colwellia hornerae TaxID=89402 RepID=A0A5C6QUL9_9GAMM|nr:pyridoxal phosphate-dependent aminotransferase [Colwellia hornerae]TWX56917.1 pyridoxal phosphate-dependent aminotransferase [Colwellia hornerae]TWX62358.1 pyridoxal phosphate-dependent aminotransferase [Colwellia hornerae]TWX72310.1 pyridoxal phosphate-dependent aminotransferase [Colwellia hornerae]
MSNTLPAHIAFGQRLAENQKVTIAHNLSNSCGQTLSVAQLCRLGNISLDNLLAEQALSYASLSGSHYLRTLIADFHQDHNHHKVKLTAENVLTFCGAQEALSAIYQTVLGEEEITQCNKPEQHAAIEIVVITPCYPSLVTMAEQMGIKVRCLTVDFQQNWQINQAALLALVNENTRLIVLNSPHNPSGSIIDTQFAEQILAVAKQFNCYLLADDVSQASNYNNLDLAHHYLDYERTIVVSVLSKSFGLAGLRIGWAVSKDKLLLKKLLAVKAQGSICSSIVDEKLAELALENHVKIISENNIIIKDNIALFQQFIDKNQSHFSWFPPQAGLLTLVKCHSDLPMLKWAEQLAEQVGIFVYPSCLFGLTGPYFRLGLGAKNFPMTLDSLQGFVDRY